jgi:hypothetical protein
MLDVGLGDKDTDKDNAGLTHENNFECSIDE